MKNGGKMVKVDKKVLMESDLVKMGGTYYYKFKEVIVNNTPMLSMSILTLSGSKAENVQVLKNNLRQTENLLKNEIECVRVLQRVPVRSAQLSLLARMSLTDLV